MVDTPSGHPANYDEAVATFKAIKNAPDYEDQIESLRRFASGFDPFNELDTSEAFSGWAQADFIDLLHDLGEKTNEELDAILPAGYSDKLERFRRMKEEEPDFYDEAIRQLQALLRGSDRDGIREEFYKKWRNAHIEKLLIDLGESITGDMPDLPMLDALGRNDDPLPILASDKKIFQALYSRNIDADWATAKGQIMANLDAYLLSRGRVLSKNQRDAVDAILETADPDFKKPNRVVNGSLTVGIWDLQAKIIAVLNG